MKRLKQKGPRSGAFLLAAMLHFRSGHTLQYLSGVDIIAMTAFFAACAFAEEMEIVQRGIRFSQTTVNVRTGDTIHYRNRDDVTHHLMVIGESGAILDKGLQKPAAVITNQFDSSGLFEVRCAIHPKMKMRVSVRP